MTARRWIMSFCLGLGRMGRGISFSECVYAVFLGKQQERGEDGIGVPRIPPFSSEAL